METLLERHAQEQKNLTSKIIGLRKSVPKSDKRKKRQVNSDIADLEYELKTRQEREIKELKGVESEDEQNELDDGISLDRLKELTVRDEPEESSKQSEQPKSKKVNKAKLRLEKRNAEMERLRQEAMEEAENQVDQAAVESAELTKLLAPMKLRIKDITADGHCLYNAFADQLRTRHEQITSYRDLRKAAAAHMRENPDDFVPFLYLEDGDFNKYCNDIENTACWGGQLEILALARSKKVPVDIIQLGGPVIHICQDEYSDKAVIKLAYHKHLYSLGAHYNSLVDIP